MTKTKTYTLTQSEAELVADILADLQAQVSCLRYNKHGYDKWAYPTKTGRAAIKKILKKLPETCGDAWADNLESSHFRPKLKHPLWRNHDEKGQP